MLTQAFACLAIAFGSLSLSSLVFRWSSAVDRLLRDGRVGKSFLLCTVSFSEICRLEDANIAIPVLQTLSFLAIEVRKSIFSS